METAFDYYGNFDVNYSLYLSAGIIAESPGF